MKMVKNIDFAVKYKYSFIFQQKAKNANKDELCNWFHQFVIITLKDDLHKECEKKITNLKNMVRAVSSNYSMIINDIDYDQGISVFKWDTEKKDKFMIMEKVYF